MKVVAELAQGQFEDFVGQPGPELEDREPDDGGIIETPGSGSGGDGSQK